jgi:hypothetical protein
MHGLSSSRFALIVGALVCACATTPRLPDYPPQSLNAVDFIVTETGLRIGVRPMSAPNELVQYFGTDLIAAGVLPVYVRVENDGEDATYLVQPDRFSLRARAGEIRPGTNYDARQQDPGDETARAGVVAFSVPLIVAGNAMISRASEVQRNLEMKELRSRTVSPGHATAGFLYFSFAQMGLPNGELSLRLEVEQTKTGVTHAVDIPMEVAPR